MPALAPAIAIAITYGALFASSELMRRYLHLSSDSTRSFVHVTSSLIALVIPLLAGWTATVILGVLFTFALSASKRRHLLPSIHGVERQTLGEVVFPLGVAATALLVPVWPAYAYGMLVLGFGDAAAGTIGRRYGRPHSILGTPKSLAGSAACFAVSLALALVFTMPTEAVTWLACLVLALTVTAAEAALGKGMDNLVLPVLAALLYRRLFEPQ